jgi:hypothetical protein
MANILEAIRTFLANLNPLWIYLLISFVGLFIYWRGCSETRKNRSSIFDTFIFSIILGLLVGRISYLTIHWSEYSRYTWYFLPYEKYGETVYLFRLLPWRFLRIWDGGLTIFVAMVVFLICITLLALFYKKWRWYQVYFPIFFSMTSMLGLSYIYLGIMDQYTLWVISGGVLLLLPLIFWAISKVLLFTIRNGIKRRKVLVYIGVLIVTVASLYISYEYLSDEVSQFEFGAVIALLVWTAIMDIFTIIDLNRPKVEIEKVSSVRAVDIEVNQPIRIK